MLNSSSKAKNSSRKPPNLFASYQTSGHDSSSAFTRFSSSVNLTATCFDVRSAPATSSRHRMHRFPTIQKNAGNFGNFETAQ